MIQELTNKFGDIIDSRNVHMQEPMNKHTTFRIGGPADYFLCPHTPEEIRDIIEVCKENKLPFFILGNGSNLLVSDQGYRGVIIQLHKNYNNIEVIQNEIHVQAGAILSAAANKALESALAGMEFAAGIPGTVGGAIVMNAGAYGGEMKDIVQSVTVLTKDGQLLKLDNQQMQFGYRTSTVLKEQYIVLEAVFKLQPAAKETIKARMEELKEQRTSKQPLEYPSAGSTFKRPEGYFAGKLIMDSGLRGKQIGGAQVSEKHCGFIINRGGATAQDVSDLVSFVQETVYNKFQIKLETEIKRLG